MPLDFQKASGHLADSKVYILKEEDQDWTVILAVFATNEAATLAMEFYRKEAAKYQSHRYGCWYYIEEREVLDQAPISKSEGPETTAMGEGPHPDPVPTTGA